MRPCESAVIVELPLFTCWFLSLQVKQAVKHVAMTRQAIRSRKIPVNFDRQEWTARSGSCAPITAMLWLIRATFGAEWHIPSFYLALIRTTTSFTFNMKKKNYRLCVSFGFLGAIHLSLWSLCWTALRPCEHEATLNRLSARLLCHDTINAASSWEEFNNDLQLALLIATEPQGKTWCLARFW